MKNLLLGLGLFLVVSCGGNNNPQNNSVTAPPVKCIADFVFHSSFGGDDKSHTVTYVFHSYDAPECSSDVLVTCMQNSPFTFSFNTPNTVNQGQPNAFNVGADCKIEN